MKPRKNEPLIRYLRVQEAWERDLLYILKRASSDVSKQIRDLAGKEGIGAKVRADQLRLVQRELKKQQASLWRTIGSTVEAGKMEAAAAAVETNFVYTDMLLRSQFTRAEIETMLESAQAQARRGLDHALSRMNGLSNIPLSQQVYRTRALSEGMVDRRIMNAIARGASWRELANDVRQFINPNVLGGVSYAAKRLGRTELNNAFHATAVTEAIENPYVTGMQWNLSGSHPKPDECNEYAEQVHYRGGEPGVYKPEQVPAKPHPNCLCFMTPEVVDEDEFVALLLRS